MIKCGIDIGGTNIKFGFFDEDNNLILFKKIKTSKNIDEIIPSIITTITRSYKPSDIIGYTVAIPGVIKDDIVIYAPNTNIVGLNIYKELSTELSNNNIIVENDANLAALAESRYTNTKDLVLITLGTGMGGGIVIDNKLYNNNGFAGEIGHIKVDFKMDARVCGCGKKGCAEAYCSAKNIVLDYNKKHNTNINSYELFKLAHKNDYDAISAINYASRKLAIAISNICATLAIKDIRIAGGLSNGKDDLLKRVRRYFLEYALPNLSDTKITVASLGSEAGIYACKYLF
ncbi:MAG: ROK family protein [Anaeroplasmataceae bacterium]